MFVLLFLFPSFTHMHRNQCTCTKMTSLWFCWSDNFVSFFSFVLHSVSGRVLKMLQCTRDVFMYDVIVFFYILFCVLRLLSLMVDAWFHCFFFMFVGSSELRVISFFFCFLIYFGTHSQIEWADLFLFFDSINSTRLLRTCVCERLLSIRLGKCTENIILIHFSASFFCSLSIAHLYVFFSSYFNTISSKREINFEER